jgi:hypothetical protein
MTPPPDTFSDVAVAVGHAPAPDACAGTASRLPHYGRPYAVPAGDVVASSHWVTEAVYRAVEIAVALTGLVRGRELEGRTDLRPPLEGYQPDGLYYVPSYFTLVKLRTMQWDAPTRFPQFYAYKFSPDEFHRQYPTHQCDPRVTRAGRVLRKLSIDELPNLWSVLIGDMRLVGPRPEAPEVLQYYASEEMYKFAYKPGITGLAQVNGRGFLNWGETLAWDLHYIRTRSVALDLKIIAATIKHVFTRRGAF